MFTCKGCGVTIPFGQSMVVMRANIGNAGELGTSHFEACYCLSCSRSFVTLDSECDCSGCGGPIIEGEEIITISLHTGTLIFDDMKFTEDSRKEVYRVHSVCFDPAASDAASSLPG